MTINDTLKTLGNQMKTITEIIKPITLLRGSHKDTGQTGQGCFMNVVAYLNGEAQITDQSKCVCVTIKPIAIWLNDYLRDNERVRMIPFIERALGSATTDKDELNRRLALVVTFAEQARDISTQSDEYANYAAKCAQYATKCAQYAAEYAATSAKYAQCANYAALCAAQCGDYAKFNFYATKSAESFIKYTEIRQQIINAAFEYLDAALPKRECTNGAVLKRAEKLAEML